MSVSQQAAVMAAIKACLEKITIANGFYSNVVRVDRGVRAIGDFQGDLPAFAIWKFQNNPDPEVYEGEENRLQIRVWGYVQCDSMYSDFEPLDKLAIDCERALKSPVYNSIYEDTFVGITQFYEGGVNENFGIFEMQIVATYSEVPVIYTDDGQYEITI